MVPGFFQHAAIDDFEETELSPCINWVDVGGNAFRAIAISLLDESNQFLSFPNIKMDVFGLTLERHFGYFPAHRFAANGSTIPRQWFKRLAESDQKLEFAITFPYTLGRVAFDAICADPLHYPEIFLQGTPSSLNDLVLQRIEAPDINFIRALAKLLQLPIEIRKVERGKEIPALEQYIFDGKDESIRFAAVLQMQADHYFIPKLISKNWHDAFLSSLPKPAPFINDPINVDNLAEIRAKLVQKIEGLLQRCDQTYQRLMKMVVSGELSINTMMTLFIHIPVVDKFKDELCFVGAEYGTQRYFDKLIAFHYGQRNVVFPSGCYDEHVASELAFATARAICCGKISWDTVYDHIGPEPLKHGRLLHQ